MHIAHETDIPYIIVDRRTNTIRIKMDIELSSIEKVELLYGDSYDYENQRDQGWNYKRMPMHLHYEAGRIQVWTADIPVPEWKRVKYSFLLFDKNGVCGIYNEYGIIYGNEENLQRFIHSYHSHFFYPYVHEEDLIQYPEWARHTVWYQIFPERFYRRSMNAGRTGQLKNWNDERPETDSYYGGDISGIIEKLDYLVSLGINGIYLTPVFEAGSNHKYDTIDYFRVDPQFGTNEDLKELVSQAHKRGIRVILDGVFNHISVRHPFWIDVVERQEKSKYKDFFCIRKFPVEEEDGYSKSLSYDTFSFVADMPKLNYENPDVKDYVISVIEYWIRECNIDGWRFDVGNEISFEFYNELKQRMKGIRDHVYFVMEIWHDSNRWFRNGYIDAGMNYAIGTAINEFLVQRVISAEEFNQRYFHLLQKLSPVHAGISFNLLDSHDTKRIMTLAEYDRKKVMHAFIMLFLLPGSPCIYYGTEVGLGGGDDPDNRRPMVWDEEKTDGKLFHFFQTLIRLRKEHCNWLQEADIIYKAEEGLSIWKFQKGNHECLLLYNQSDEERMIAEGKIIVRTSGRERMLEKDSMAVVLMK